MGVGRIDDGEAARVEFEMPLDKRQNSPPDGAEAYQDDGARNFAVNGP